MKQASKILYIVAIIFSILEVVLLVGSSIFYLVALSVPELFNFFVDKLSYLANIHPWFEDKIVMFTRIILISQGISYAFSAIPYVIAIPLYNTAKNKLEDLENSNIGTFIVTIVFGVLTSKFGIAAGALAVVARAFAIRNKKRKVVSEQ